MLRNLLTALLACAAFVGQGSMAAPIAYDEGASGDILNNTFVLDLGTNTITGTMRFAAIYDSEGVFIGYDSDIDPFFFTFASNAFVSSLNVSTSFTPRTTSTMGATTRWELTDNVGAPAGMTCQTFLSPFPGYGCPSSATEFIGPDGGALFAAEMPLALAFDGGVYRISQALTILGGPATTFGFDFAYTLTFDVQSASVPEPSTLALLGVSLFGLAAVRRRKH